jgi:hypothetical protein
MTRSCVASLLRAIARSASTRPRAAGRHECVHDLLRRLGGERHGAAWIGLPLLSKSKYFVEICRSTKTIDCHNRDCGPPLELWCRYSIVDVVPNTCVCVCRCVGGVLGEKGGPLTVRTCAGWAQRDLHYTLDLTTKTINAIGSPVRDIGSDCHRTDI